MDLFAAVGVAFMLGPWADPVTDLKHPALEMLAGEAPVVMNAKVCGQLVLPGAGFGLVSRVTVDAACHEDAAITLRAVRER